MSKKVMLFCVLIIALSMACTAFIYGNLPERIATNFNIRGQADGFSPRWMIFIIGGVFPAALMVLFALIPKLDPKGDSYAKHKKAYNFLCISITVFLLIVHWIIVITALGKRFPAAAVIMRLTGLLFAFLGNFLPQVRPNYSFGIRLPWTLDSDDNWRATHRVGGRAFMLGGLLMAVSAFFPQPAGTAVFFDALAALILVPVVYSYAYYKRNPKP